MSELKRRVRCAVYTRKSSEEGLEQEFNSLDAQREAGEAYIASQRHEGWILVPDYYDDGGFSGGTMERPALKRLINDIKAGLIDVVVIYKMDRLSRVQLDFLKMLALFEEHNVSFVSVTQFFNTKDAMGKLMLNVLTAFAQFERDVTGERIRDKVAASKRKGMWMGGFLPLGYDVVNRKLIINEDEAAHVKWIFERYITLRSTTMLMREARIRGVKTKSFITQNGNTKIGRFLTKDQIYRILQNRIYLGEIIHKDKVYDGLHEPIISKGLFDEARSIIQIYPGRRGKTSFSKTPALLKGLVYCGAGCNSAMSPVHTRKNGKLYRYYKANRVVKSACESCPIAAVPAGDLEARVMDYLQQIFKAPDVIVKTWAAAYSHDKSITEHDVKKALNHIGPVWKELFPVEQARIVNLLIEKIMIDKEGMNIHMCAENLHKLARDFSSLQTRNAA